MRFTGRNRNSGWVSKNNIDDDFRHQRRVTECSPGLVYSVALQLEFQFRRHLIPIRIRRSVVAYPRSAGFTRRN